MERLKNAGAAAAKIRVGREFLTEKVNMSFTGNTPSKFWICNSDP